VFGKREIYIFPVFYVPTVLFISPTFSVERDRKRGWRVGATEMNIKKSRKNMNEQKHDIKKKIAVTFTRVYFGNNFINSMTTVHDDRSKSVRTPVV
jgi:hypothetical protein